MKYTEMRAKEGICSCQKIKWIKLACRIGKPEPEICPDCDELIIWEVGE